MTSTLHHACAKINLGLNVLGKRPDGYHDLESIFLEVDLCDDVLITAASTVTLECHPSVTGSVQDNLAFKAALLLQNALSAPDKGAKIVLTKRIPTGGGLGGGSSDAAAVLKGLYELWTHQPASTPEALAILHPLAAQLGSDVPFFLTGGVAYVTGRGTEISPLPVSVPWTVLLVLPDIHIATSTAYSTLGITQRVDNQGLDRLLRQVLENNGDGIHQFKNDFESTIFAQHPLLSTISRKLTDNGAIYAAMSGSGSTMYGLFTSVENAVAARSAFPNHVTYICRPIVPHVP